jgi:YHS domain-containing protein
MNRKGASEMEIDPVCKMEVEVATAQWKSEYGGRTYYFCSPGCKRSFEKTPQKYLNPSQAETDHPAHTS